MSVSPRRRARAQSKGDELIGEPHSHGQIDAGKSMTMTNGLDVYRFV